MAAIIRIKRSTGAAAPGTLKSGELSYSAGVGTQANLGDRLFFGKGDDGSGNATTVEVIGGAYFANMLDHVAGTLTASSAIIVDASSKIDNLKVDNIDINGNTISSTDTNGNVILDPNGNGTVDVSSSRITSVTDPSDPQDAATKAYVDAQNTAQILTINGDTGSDTVDLNDSSLTFAGDSWMTATVSNNTVTITHDASGAVAGVYGSQIAIPIITVDDRGHIDSIGTVSVATVLDFVADGTPGSVNLLDSSFIFVGGEGIDLSTTGTTITIAGEDATSSNKGVASFDATDFTVTSGAVVANPIYLGTTRLDLGETDSNIAGLNSIEVGDVRITSNVISSRTTGTLFIDPNPVGDSAGGFGGELVIRGNLTVQGTTTTVNSTTLSINDKNIVLADSAVDATAADGAGITIGGDLYSGTKPSFRFDAAANAWSPNIALDMDDSISGVNSIYFDGTKITEAITDYLAYNVFFGNDSSGLTITYNDASDTIVFSNELATTTNIGVAKFGGYADADSADGSGTNRQFQVSSGNVWIREVDGGIY